MASLADVDREIGKLDPTIEYPPRVEVDKPRGRVRFAKKVHLPYGWLESPMPPPTKSVRRSSGDIKWTWLLRKY